MRLKPFQINLGDKLNDHSQFNHFSGRSRDTAELPAGQYAGRRDCAAGRNRLHLSCADFFNVAFLYFLGNQLASFNLCLAFIRERLAL